MRVKRIVNKPIGSNCFVIYGSHYPFCVVIDPGDKESEELLEFLSKNNFIPKYIILTHHHFDHIWGVEKLKNEFPVSQIVCSEITGEMIVDRKKNCSLYYDQQGFITPASDIVINKEVSEIIFENQVIQIISAKGHSNGGIMILMDKNLFTGDTLIKDERTVLKLPTASKADFLNTLKIIETLKGRGLMVRGGHGPSFRLDNYDITKSL